MTREQIEEIRKGCDGVTPGKWNAAAKPSSVVGWPIVSQTGRNIASMNYVQWSSTNPAVSGDRAFNRESKSNAEHIARLDPATVRALCDLALAGLDAEAAFRRGQEDMRERAARACEEEAKIFADPTYAGQNPLNSFAERFGCKQSATAIRSLPIEGESK